MVAIVMRIANGLRSLTGWKESCPPGGPVPEQHKCESACCPSRPVTTLDAGGSGVVSCLTDPDHPKAARLASLGILPGIPVRLIQTYPAYVLRVGFAEIALDEELARMVRVITGSDRRAAAPAHAHDHDRDGDPLHTRGGRDHGHARHAHGGPHLHAPAGRNGRRR